ncbi:MAG: TolC family protein [Gammaproteobacteria bacterium]|nr:TolC family protein [Gammaproteobacteria bacterium]
MERKARLRIVCLALLSGPACAHALDLWDAYQLALTKDPAYQREVNLHEATRQRIPQARSALLPQIDATAAHSRGYLETDPGDEHLSERGDGLAGGPENVAIPPFQFEPSPIPREDDYHTSRASVTLSQTLFDRASSRALDSARSQADEAGLQLANARQALILETAGAYYDYLSAEDALDTARLELEAVRTQRQLTERRYEEKLGTLTDVHESRARMELARVDIIDAGNEQALARHRLAKLIGGPVDDVHRLPESFDPPPLVPSDRDYWLEQALKHSLDVRISSQQATTAELELERQRSGHWPTLSLVGESTFEQDGSSAVYAGRDQFRNEVSIRLRIPLFRGFGIQSRVKEAHYRMFAAEQGVLDAEAGIARDVGAAYDSLQASSRRVEALRQAYEQSLSALELRKQGYLEGLSSNLNLLDAFRDAYRAKRQWLQSRYRFLTDYLTIHSLSATVGDDLVKRLDGYLEEEPE